MSLEEKSCLELFKFKGARQDFERLQEGYIS